MELEKFFNPKTVAVIGASRNPEKVGHVLLKNLVESGEKMKRNIIPINPNAKEILEKKAYPKITDVKERIDLAIIAIPAKFVPQAVEQCKEKGVKNLIIVSSGFSETGDKETEKRLKDYLDTNKMMAIGVNCLGIFDAHTSMDALFIPKTKMRRPAAGGISFVCQSGAIGLAIIDIAASEDYRFAKFISYGNATQLDESDYLEYLAKDKDTKVICMYIEGVKDGEKFYKTAKRIADKKPIIIVKGGLTKEGDQATLSHTGTLAGKKETYFGIFNQANLIRADNLEEMFNIASILENPIEVKGSRVQIVTNGGGYGIISTDKVSESKELQLTTLSDVANNALRKVMPSYVNIRNPLDISGDATSKRYATALKHVSKDKNVDIILLIALYQTPLLSDDVVSIIEKAKASTKKPIMVVSTGSEFTENLSSQLRKHKVPVFSFPHLAIDALDKIVGYKRRLEMR